MAPARAPVSHAPVRAATPLNMASDTTSLSLTARDPEGSRSARRLRRSGLVPGVIYGEGGSAEHFAVDARILRNTLAHSGAILEVSIDGGKGEPVLVKDLQRHPVRGEAVHVDLLRVDMSETIQTTVVARARRHRGRPPGVVEGGVLNQETRELNIEALPGDIPDSIVFDVSGHGDQRHGHAVRAHRAGGRHAARRSGGDRRWPRSPRRRSSRSRTRSRPRPSWSARTASRSSPPRARARRAGGDAEASSESAKRTPEVRLVHARRLAGRRARQPRARLRRVPAQRRLQGRRGAGAPLGAAASPSASTPASWPRGAPGRAGRASPCCCPQTYMNDAGRSVGPARGAYKLELDRVLVLHDEIDLPFGDIRVAPRRRPGRPQRAEVAAPRARLTRLPPRPRGRRPAGLHRPRDRRRLRARPLAPAGRRGRRPRRPCGRRGRAPRAGRLSPLPTGSPPAAVGGVAAGPRAAVVGADRRLLLGEEHRVVAGAADLDERRVVRAAGPPSTNSKCTFTFVVPTLPVPSPTIVSNPAAGLAGVPPDRRSR